MEYQTPQFIEVEDKIFGPLTLRQFIYLAGSAGVCILTFFTLPFIAFVLISLPVAAFGLALTFYKMNNKPFIEVVEAAFNYFISNRLYLWRRDTNSKRVPDAQIPTAAALEAERRSKTPQITAGKLRDLAWSLDIKDHQVP
jgi:hypothetical protein